MNLLIASDKFKGSLTAAEACAAIRLGFENSPGEAGLEISTVPIADGGEGMARAISDAKSGEWIELDTEDALGRLIRAGYGWIASESLAVIEMAEASGLWRLPPGENRDPWRASTHGTGILIRHAIHELQARQILLGIGGSATNDGGTGMARALGYRFLDRYGNEVSDLPGALETVEQIDRETTAPFPRVLVACDVTNPLLGENGCTRVYGPQKGISESDFEKHETRLKHLVTLTGRSGIAAAETPGAGAAGGLGFGCMTFLNASLRPGFDLVADVLDLEAAVLRADLVITGEGRLDSQTLQGKAPAGMAAMVRKHGKPVVAFAGIIEPGSEALLASTFNGIFPIASGGLPVSESMARGAELLAETVRQNSGRILAMAKPLSG